ncbi:MAG: hypothetical protein ACYDDB_03170 [bacterium]
MKISLIALLKAVLTDTNTIYKFRIFGVAFRPKGKQVQYLTTGNGVSERKINIEADMGKLMEFYKQHRRLFIAQKHQNTRQTEKFKDMVMLKFLEYCESKGIFHTDGIHKKKIIIDFFNTGEMLNKSNETRRKYFLVIAEFYKKHFKVKLIKEEILK